MAFEIITLNLIPDGEMPVFHASQFDTARPVIIDLVMGKDAYVVPEGITLELHCRKVDDTIVTMEPDEVSGNRVTFVTTEQLTACIGDNLCEVAVLNGDDHIGTLNFILHVEPDPLAGGLTSESDIYNLTQQIEAIAQEVIGEDYYNKSEVNSLLAEKADIEDLPDMSNYYRKSETYSKEQVYNKEETYSRVQMSENYYNKSESRSIFASQNWVLNQMQLEGTASGAIASFETAAPRQWLTALKCTMLASGGGGTPDNPIQIVGFTECNITNEDGEGNVIDEITIDLNGTRYGGYVDVNNGKLVVTHEIVDLGSLNWGSYSTRTANVYRLTAILANKPTPDNQVFDALCEVYGAISGNATYNCNKGISGSSDGARIYVYDVNYNTSTSAAAFKTAMSGKHLVYPLATPIEIDISPEHLYANVGQNNVFHDGNGTTEVKYKDTIQHYIDTRL